MRRLLIALILMTAQPITAEESPSTHNSATETKCADWDRFSYPEYFVENNVWGKKEITDYKQCLFKQTDENGSFGWEWRWPTGAPDVVAYPEICFGYKPWGNQSTTPDLPLQVSKVKSAVITYDLVMKAEGIYNLAFDAWLTSEAIPAEKNITAEIMIWLNHETLRPDGETAEAVTIDGEEYDFYTGHPPHAGWPYHAFIKKTPEFSGKTDLGKFLKFLVKNGHASGDDYLASIEFGNEIHSGTGKTELKKYNIKVTKR